jgi:outer membrane protein
MSRLRVRWVLLLLAGGLFLQGVAVPARAQETRPVADRPLPEDLLLPPGEDLPLSLEETIQRARAASARLEQLRALRDGAEAGLKEARAGRLPQIDFTAGYSRYSNVPELSIPLPPPQGPRVIYPNIPDNYATHLEMSLPLFTGGRLSSLIDAADRGREAAGKEVESGSQDLVMEASTDYWNLVTALESEVVLREAREGYDAHLQDARRRQKYGLAASNEVLAVQVECDRAELAEVQAARDAETIRADLARLLGLPAETRIRPTAALERLETPAEDLSALLQEARDSRPDRAALKARAEAADALSRAARAERFPQVSLSAGYDYLNPNRRILPWETTWQDSWDASIALSFRLFDGGRTAASVEKSSAQAEAAHKQLEDLDRRIAFEVTRRTLELRSAGLSVQVAERSLESARENRRVASDRYRAGVIPSSELLDAEVALLRAGLERTGALAGQRLALAALDRAVGR